MLTQALITQLLWTARLNVPLEMCGLLFNDNDLYSMENTETNPLQSFKIDHGDFMQACQMLERLPWAIVHSHPGERAVPSVKDCQLMDALEFAGKDLAMVIVGLNPVEVRVFRKREHVYKCEWAWVQDAV